MVCWIHVSAAINKLGSGEKMTDTNLLIQKESFFKKFVKHKLATVAFVILAIEVIGIYLGPVFFNLDPYYIDTAALGAS